MKKFQITNKKSRKNANSSRFCIKIEYIINGNEDDVFCFSGIIDGKLYNGEIPYSYIYKHCLVFTPYANIKFVKLSTFQSIKKNNKPFGEHHYVLMPEKLIKEYFEQHNVPIQLSLF